MIQAIVCSLVFISGRRNVFLRPDELNNLRRVAARHALQFARRHPLRVANHPALRAAKGILTTAHFHVIQLASARTSSRVTSGE